MCVYRCVFTYIPFSKRPFYNSGLPRIYVYACMCICVCACVCLHTYLFRIDLRSEGRSVLLQLGLTPYINICMYVYSNRSRVCG